MSEYPGPCSVSRQSTQVTKLSTTVSWLRIVTSSTTRPSHIHTYSGTLHRLSSSSGPNVKLSWPSSTHQVSPIRAVKGSFSLNSRHAGERVSLSHPGATSRTKKKMGIHHMEFAI